MNKRGTILFSSVVQFEFSLNQWLRKLGLSTCALVAWHSFLRTEVERDSVASHICSLYTHERPSDWITWTTTSHSRHHKPRTLCAKDKSSGVEIGLRVRVLTSGTRFSKSRELFGPQKLVVKLQFACFEKLIFLHVFNIRKSRGLRSLKA